MKNPILLVSIFFLILILGIIFLWWPQYQAFNNLKEEIKVKKIELQAKEEYFSYLEEIPSKLKNYDSELKKIDSALPSSPEVLHLLNFVWEKSLQNGLILEKIEIGNTSPLKDNGKELEILKIHLGFSFSGSYLAFKNFISELQKSARLIEVEELSFKTITQKEIFSFDLKIWSHFYNKSNKN